MAYLNILTQKGEEWIIDQLITETLYGAWGTDGTEASKSDTALGNEGSEGRVQATASEYQSDTIQWVFTITADGTKTIRECGLFTSQTGGNLIIRCNFADINVNENDKIEFTIRMEAT
ncbi:MAG: hypothetical protein QW754_06525 [Thermoplasmata archaeon]